MKNKKKLWRIKKTKKEKELSTKEIKGEKLKKHKLKNTFKVSLNLGLWPHSGF